MNGTRTRRRPPTAAEAQRALRDVEALFKVTPLMKASADFQSAKGEFDAATLAVMNREPGCEARADRALAMLNEARAALRRIEEEERA